MLVILLVLLLPVVGAKVTSPLTNLLIASLLNEMSVVVAPNVLYSFVLLLILDDDSNDGSSRFDSDSDNIIIDTTDNPNSSKPVLGMIWIVIQL